MSDDSYRELLNGMRDKPFTDEEWEESERLLEEATQKEYRKMYRNDKKIRYFSSLTKMERDYLIIDILEWNKRKEDKWNFKCYRLPHLLIDWFKKNSIDKTFERSLEEQDDDFLNYHGVLENWEYTIYSGQGSFHVFKIKDKEYTIG